MNGRRVPDDGSERRGSLNGAQLWADPRVAAVPVDGYRSDEVASALDAAAGLLGWHGDAGPFDAVIPPGARVLVKPNWVLHANQGPWGVEPLVTHAAVVRAVTHAALRTGASHVAVGDAPVQGCDFDALVQAGALDGWARELAARDPRFGGLLDFRRTRAVMRAGVREAREDAVAIEEFVLFDLAGESLLEPVTSDAPDFRVTQYHPEKMAHTHRRGRHQYLVARAVMDADVLLNLPKLKTHKKAGVTCALKNLIGINGNKEFLPHHRVGGAEAGGDCYPGASPVKRALEYTFDRLNSSSNAATAHAWATGARVLQKVAHLQGDALGVEGSWSGNDTIWRTCLDLNRILLYGRADGTLADTPQRRVVNVVDAIVAGHGDGPLAPQPLPLGLLLLGASSAAVDWTGAQLLGYDPARIPIAREAFGRFRWPLAAFGTADISLLGATDALAGGEEVLPPGMSYPLGWLDAVRAPARARAAPDGGRAEG